METTEHKDHIQLLPEHIIDQIKAGEVIERPSTLIKEILENSIDAGSNKIDLHIVDNGLELIAISDNGKGINAKELPLAFYRHATSKIGRFEDIYHLNSYGFRGEALASIASISKISCDSKTHSQTGLIKINGGEITFHDQTEEFNQKTGTKIYIRDLFYNTPVRMKFIQSKTSEKNQIIKIIRSFLLINPQISFSIKWDQAEKEIYPIATQEKRILDVLFKGKETPFLHSQTDYDGISFQIFLSEESSRGNAHKHHFIFINNRYIQDIQIHKIIINSAKHLWPDGETGHYIAKLYVPNDEIDVNVHPNKTVVKLFKAPKIYSIISGTIKAKINIPSKVNSQTPQNELGLEFQDETNDLPLAKEIDYKKIDFTQSSEVNHYLDHIHDQQNVFHLSHRTQFIFFESMGIHIEDNQALCFKKLDIYHYYLQDLLEKIENDPSKESIPLLVSRPLKISEKINETLDLYIKEIGFEYDLLDEKTVVVRSFPKDFQHITYLEFLEFILNQNTIPINISNFSPKAIAKSLIEKIISNNFNILKAKKLLSPIDESTLVKIYGK